jgi:hypothetical protein
MKPIAEDIGHTSQRIQGRRYLDDIPNKSRKLAPEEEVFNSFIMMTKNTSGTSVPVSLNKIIFGFGWHEEGCKNVRAKRRIVRERWVKDGIADRLEERSSKCGCEEQLWLGGTGGGARGRGRQEEDAYSGMEV